MEIQSEPLITSLQFVLLCCSDFTVSHIPPITWPLSYKKQKNALGGHKAQPSHFPRYWLQTKRFLAVNLFHPVFKKQAGEGRRGRSVPTPSEDQWDDTGGNWESTQETALCTRKNHTKWSITSDSAYGPCREGRKPPHSPCSWQPAGPSPSIWNPGAGRRVLTTKAPNSLRKDLAWQATSQGPSLTLETPGQFYLP